MSASVIIFYLLATFILVTGLLAVTTGKIFRSAIWLLLSLTGIAGLYFWLQLEFIAAVQIIVYVGGIVVLILFSLFLTQRSGTEMARPALGRTLFSILASVIGFVLVYAVIYLSFSGEHLYRRHLPQPALDASVSTIGMQLLSTKGYALPFEVVSVLLLAAMVGCIVIALKIKPVEK